VPATCIKRKSITMKAKSKLMPSLTSDKEAKRFVETADLSNYDLSGFKPMHFEFEPKTAALNMRLPQKLLATLKVKAKAKGIPYSRYVRLLLEKDVDINNNSKITSSTVTHNRRKIT